MDADSRQSVQVCGCCGPACTPLHGVYHIRSSLYSAAETLSSLPRRTDLEAVAYAPLEALPRLHEQWAQPRGRASRAGRAGGEPGADQE